MTRDVKDRVHSWLDDAATAMAGQPSHRRDVLLELETTIYDRLEERTREGQDEGEALEAVLREIGDPTLVGSSFLPARPLVDAHRTRPFLIHTLLLFVAHFLVVIGATVAHTEFGVSELRMDPIPQPVTLFAVFLRAVRTLLMDAGMMLVLYAFLPRLGRVIRFPRLALATRPDTRRCLDSAFFMALVAVVVNFLRDDLLALYLPAERGAEQVSLVGPGLRDNLLFLNLWLGAAILRDLLYARFSERRATLLVDLFAGAAGLFCLLRVVAAERLVDLAHAQDVLGTTADGLAALLNTVFGLIALAGAALIGMRMVRRAFRLTLLRAA